MNENRLDALLRAAQPHQSTGDLGGLLAAEHQLLEGIMATPTTDETPGTDLHATPFDDPHVGVWTARGARRRPLIVLAAAAAVVLAVALPAWWIGRQDSVTVVPASNETPPGDHIVVDLPGWHVVGMYSDADNESIQYARGDDPYAGGKDTLELNRAPAKDYSGFDKDRGGEGMDVGRATALGQEGNLYTYRKGERYELMLPPKDGAFMYIDVYSKRSDVDTILGALKFVDDATWEQQVPDDFVTASNASAMTRQMLADIPLPPGLSARKLAKAYDQDYYQFGAHVTGQVSCGWIGDWIEAKKDGDAKERAKAEDAMASSHDWTVLKKIEKQGGWSQAVWELADSMRTGTDVPGGKAGLTVEDTYKDALGC